MLFSLPWFGLAQKASELFNAEKAFAAYSVQNGTRAAFLNFADSNGLVFEEGKAVNAIATWEKHESRLGVLNWRPVYGMVAASGDLGFTTGPWTFQPKSVEDSVVARGQYCTVWHKTKDGEWKFLIDLGVNNVPAFDAPVHLSNAAFVPGTLNDLQQVEQAFVQNTKDSGSRTEAYNKAVSKEAFVLGRNGQPPVVDAAGIASLVSAMPTTIVYELKGSAVSKSGDLGYAYGNTVINGKADNYLRIWRREKNEWKLVTEVLRY